MRIKYLIDIDCMSEGGSVEFFPIKDHADLGFKQFRNKKTANNAYKKQKLLSKFHLAPRVVGQVCKLPITIEAYSSFIVETNWGYITESAKIVDENIMQKRLDQIQYLVEKIEKKTGLQFWDCHYWNIGYIKRNNKTKLVCIDTGQESFDRESNAWGFGKPGPKCNYCENYQCVCNTDYD